MSASASVGSLPQAGVWSIDSMHSTVVFSVRHHAVATFRSSFTNITGRYDGAQRRLVGEVPVSEITLPGLERLKGHILTSDFFNAEEYPTFSFSSDTISESGDELVVEGELTLRGVSRAITATGSFRGPQTTLGGDGSVTERIGIDLVTSIDRRKWGIDFNNEIAEGIANLGWDVKIEAALELFLSSED